MKDDYVDLLRARMNASGSGVTFADAFTTANFTDTTAGSVLKFNNGSTYTISGTLILTGTSSSHISLNTSTGAAAAFTLDMTGSTQHVNYVTVANSNVSSHDLWAHYSTNSGGNDDGAASPHWVFAAPPYAFSMFF